MLCRRFRAGFLIAGLLAVGLSAGGAGRAQDPPKKAEVRSSEETFDSVDGVKLRGVFYNAVAPMGGDAEAPVVLMLHPYGADPDQAKWASTAELIASRGLHVFRFDFRGHGKSTDVTPRDFWASPTWANWGQINKGLIKGSEKSTTKGSVSYKEFKSGYYAMLVQDIAAARTHLDKKNDAGKLNASSIYLLGAGDAVNLGLLFLAAEWNRERRRPDSVVMLLRVFPGRRLYQGFDAAGLDYRGAVWLGPVAPHSTVSNLAPQTMKNWVANPVSLPMRMETQMLFEYGAKDTKAESYARNLYRNVLMIAPKDMNNPKATATGTFPGPDGRPLPNPDQTYYAAIKDSAATGVNLLGNNLKTEEYIEQFVRSVEQARQKRERIDRGWGKDRPLYIDPIAFGAMK